MNHDDLNLSHAREQALVETLAAFAIAGEGSRDLERRLTDGDDVYIQVFSTDLDDEPARISLHVTFLPNSAQVIDAYGLLLSNGGDIGEIDPSFFDTQRVEHERQVLLHAAHETELDRTRRLVADHLAMAYDVDLERQIAADYLDISRHRVSVWDARHVDGNGFTFAIERHHDQWTVSWPLQISFCRSTSEPDFYDDTVSMTVDFQPGTARPQSATVIYKVASHRTHAVDESCLNQARAYATMIEQQSLQTASQAAFIDSTTSRPRL